MTPDRHRWLRILTWVDLSLATIAQRLTTELDSHLRQAQTNARTPPVLSPAERALIAELAGTCREGMTYTDRLASLLEAEHPEHTSSPYEAGSTSLLKPQPKEHHNS